jgi:transposase InsO family protein
MSTEVHEHEDTEARARADRDAATQARRDEARARRDTAKPVSTEPGYVDAEERMRANQEAAAAAKAQTEIYTGMATERGIQCQKAHELVDLWFSDWDAEKVKRWVALTASDGDVPDLTPNVDHVLALIGLCLGFAPVHEIAPPPAAAAATDAEREAAEHADQPTEEPRPNQY